MAVARSSALAARPWSRDIEVYVVGTQDADGSAQRGIIVHELHHDDP
ncbi:MAG TPA: hypothetical protein VED43_13085 [Mycobacterium sp.]|nr:hypothetical protein [Mycobacterium sp.]